MLRQPVTLTTEEMAEKLGSDTQTVLAALEQLERMGYILNTCPQCNSGQNCKGCSGCSLASTQNISNIRIYSIR
ncbi:FeoC-like transcriptional regulator [Faecalispora jeddahensis]|uniref:FeoC-like transcriptional regulator n=1 Tax=Faecalispora jeddahensis TaxID=1414721 RepID=UPI00398D3F32